MEQFDFVALGGKIYIHEGLQMNMLVEGNSRHGCELWKVHNLFFLLAPRSSRYWNLSLPIANILLFVITLRK